LTPPSPLDEPLTVVAPPVIRFVGLTDEATPTMKSQPLRSNRSIPSAAVIPELAYENVPAAAEWLCRAFGFRIRLRIADHRIQLTWRDGAIVVVEASRDGAAQTSRVLVRIPDADAHHAAAVRAGAKILSPPTVYPFGEKQYSAEDLAGHRWTFSESVADVDPADWGGTLTGE
jgi:uncharacterized glyoxalase superfamily protein PhnB